jgi:hypothetical protein
MSVDTFMTELMGSTEPNPIWSTERIYRRRGCVRVFPIGRLSQYSHFGGRDMVSLTFIRSLERGKGYGTETLDWLTTLADRHQVTIHLMVEPCGTIRPRLSKRELIRWYKRHGFKEGGGPLHLFRDPEVTS